MNTVKQLVSGVILVLVMFFLVSASLLLSELSYKAHDFILSLTLLTGSGVLTGGAVFVFITIVEAVFAPHKPKKTNLESMTQKVRTKR